MAEKLATIGRGGGDPTNLLAGTPFDGDGQLALSGGGGAGGFYLADGSVGYAGAPLLGNGLMSQNFAPGRGVPGSAEVLGGGSALGNDISEADRQQLMEDFDASFADHNNAIVDGNDQIVVVGRRPGASNVWVPAEFGNISAHVSDKLTDADWIAAAKGLGVSGVSAPPCLP